jgi:hypothetical protein
MASVNLGIHYVEMAGGKKKAEGKTIVANPMPIS